MGVPRRASGPPTLWNRDQAKQDFLDSEVNHGYGYQLGADGFAAQVAAEYPALKDTVYLDAAASPPAPLSTLQAFTTSISSTLYSNPHSRSPSSLATSSAIDTVRDGVLEEVFGLTTPAQRASWDIVFTSGATAAMKLVGESFGWSAEGEEGFLYTSEAHTSLVGVRELAMAKGAAVASLTGSEVESWLADEPAATDDKCQHSTLFAYPAQCNATGARLGLELGRRVKRRRPFTAVLLDAAAYLSSSPLHLASIPLPEAPDFVACSFYKLFGYPTGLGCLLVKLSSAPLLTSKTYFGGGTIDAISVSNPFWSRRRNGPSVAVTTDSRSTATTPKIHHMLEDGTLPFLSIIALGNALDTHKKLYGSLTSTSLHTSTLASFARSQLDSLHHENGQKVVHLHSAFSTFRDRLKQSGPTIAFTLHDPAGKPVGHVMVDRLATINGFQLRTGGLCNTGVLSAVAGLTDGDLWDLHEKGRRCWDDEEFIGDDDQRPLGLCRISFGAYSTIDDVLDFISFVRRHFVISASLVAVAQNTVSRSESPELPVSTLQSLVLYPIKSCGGQLTPSSTSWEITPTGLAFDRQWILVSPTTGQTLSQKRYPRMALIRPVVDLEAGVLRVRAKGMNDLVLSLDAPPRDEDSEELELLHARLCGDAVKGQSEGALADEWFEKFLGMPCRLQRHASTTSARHGHFDHVPHPVPILQSNESPFLLITRESVDQVNEWITSESGSDSELSTSSSISSTSSVGSIHASCFRANFVLSSDSSAAPPPFFEDDVTFLRIGSPSTGATFQVLARCRRCLMVCVDQSTGEKTREPFSCLARTRKSEKGRIEFGVHLLWRQDLSYDGKASLRVGDKVVFSSAVG